METVAPYAEIIQMIKEAGGEAFKLCYQCGKCDVVCPWNRVRDFSIRKIIRQASLGLTEIELEEIWRCTTCGTCPTHCPRGVPQIEIGVSLRRIATEYGVLPGLVRAAGTAATGLRIDGNPLNEAREKRADWAKGLGVKSFEEGTELLYFVGCYYSYDPRLKKAATATAKLLNAAGVDYGILGPRENCCGESIRKTGNEEVFKTVAKENVKAFIDAGVKKILVASPHCYETFVNEYSEFMVHFEVVHLSQLLQELLESGRLELSGSYDKTVAYHDPCYLGRHNDIYDPPRQVLGRVPGLKLVEMRDHHQDSLCCGGGGGGVWMETAKEERFSNLRLQQARDAEATVLATSCPYCVTMFEESRLTLELEDAIEVKDLAEILQEAL